MKVKNRTRKGKKASKKNKKSGVFYAPPKLDFFVLIHAPPRECDIQSKDCTKDAIYFYVFVKIIIAKNNFMLYHVAVVRIKLTAKKLDLI